MPSKADVNSLSMKISDRRDLSLTSSLAASVRTKPTGFRIILSGNNLSTPCKRYTLKDHQDLKNQRNFPCKIKQFHSQETLTKRSLFSQEIFTKKLFSPRWLKE